MAEAAAPRKAKLLESMGLGGTAAAFAVNFTHPIVSSAFSGWINAKKKKKQKKQRAREQSPKDTVVSCDTPLCWRL
jgi:hypothetical protein